MIDERTTRPGPGGVGDGLPSLPTGEPVLHRWFVLLMLLLVPAGIAVSVWALTSFDRPEVDPAARRPPGDTTATHDRGDAVLNEDRTTEAGRACAAGVGIVGDPSARAALDRALAAVCVTLERPAFRTAARGLERLASEDGMIRMAVFELTGVESTTRVEQGRLVIELNAKFQFENATRAAPAIIHELVHLATGWPDGALDVDAELAAVEAQHAACELLNFGGDPPRGCRDVAELLAEDDPRGQLRAAGYPLP